MATIHNTTLVPSKLNLIGPWLPGRPWYRGTAAGPSLARAGGFRLDDPAGEVGLEFMAVADGTGEEQVIYHLPLSYRGAPLDGAEDALIGTAEHGVLGRRWVYDGTRDPVLTARLFALFLGEAEPQAQRISDTPDPAVTRYLTGNTGGLPAQVLAVTDDERGTSIAIRPAGAPGEVRLAVIRRLTPARPALTANQPALPVGVLGQVTGQWTPPPGVAPARGRFAELRVP